MADTDPTAVTYTDPTAVTYTDPTAVTYTDPTALADAGPTAVADAGSTAVAGVPEVLRLRLRVTGTVQGVGFRPFVYRRAVSLGLAGFVCNDSAGVLIEVEGPAAGLRALQRVVAGDPPPLARVTAVEATQLRPTGAQGFVIVATVTDGTPAVAVGVDTATCDACLAELNDPADRRYRYPFTNCTNCGPRYTIITSVPYDRPGTTMARFAMCAECRHEYDDPGDRRFHAQPNACWVCGPRLRWCTPAGEGLAEAGDALVAAVAALRSGAIVAVKGLGGFHLAADATDPAAVGELRQRKARDDKPFALMVADLAVARLLVETNAGAEAALASARRPIVLLPRRPLPGVPIAGGVAPGLPELGVMLAYTPLHHLLLSGAGRPLVMTSGNLSDDPIAYTDQDAFQRLGPLVDGILTHDRDIHIRCDDSVVRSSGGRLQLLRRSRGYAPEPLALPHQARRQVLAVGAELKSTVTVATGRRLVTSHHIGDLEHLATYRSFLQAIDHMCDLAGVSPEVVAHDLHPEYLSTKLALELDMPSLAVQHHHAHIASCLVEHCETGPVLGLAFDGLGLGTDGVLWGGEFLHADLAGFQRVGHLRAAPLPGGSAAIREPWRMGVSWAYLAAGRDAALRHGCRLDSRAPAVVGLVERALSTGSAPGAPATPETTSAGRLFDAVAALLGVRSRVSYEGQAAIELEALSARIPSDMAPLYPVAVADLGGIAELDAAPLVAAVLEEVERGTPAAVVAAGFHRSLALGAVDVATDLCHRHRITTVALSGGVFQNSRLTDLVHAGLAGAGLRVLVHRNVPPNDGGISIGQAAVAAAARTVQAAPA